MRRAALLTLNWAAHNKPALVREHLPKYLPVLYSEAKVKPELIREVRTSTAFLCSLGNSDCFVFLLFCSFESSIICDIGKK